MKLDMPQEEAKTYFGFFLQPTWEFGERFRTSYPDKYLEWNNADNRTPQWHRCRAVEDEVFEYHFDNDEWPTVEPIVDRLKLRHDLDDEGALRWVSEAIGDGNLLLEREEVPTLRAYRKNGQLVVNCPHCQKPHYHGAVGSAFGSGDGHRIGHCRDPRSPYLETGYLIEESIEPALPHEGYRFRLKDDIYYAIAARFFFACANVFRETAGL